MLAYQVTDVFKPISLSLPLCLLINGTQEYVYLAFLHSILFSDLSLLHLTVSCTTISPPPPPHASSGLQIGPLRGYLSIGSSSSLVSMALMQGQLWVQDYKITTLSLPASYPSLMHRWGGGAVQALSSTSATTGYVRGLRTNYMQCLIYKLATQICSSMEVQS